MPTLHSCPCGGEVSPGGKAPEGGAECLKCGRVFVSGEALIAAGGGWMHVCIRGGRRPKVERCQVEWCTGVSVALCDEPNDAGPGTCDFRMCVTHRLKVGRNRDRCPRHAAGMETLTRGGTTP